MMNAFRIKKFVALIILVMIPTLIFTIISMTNGILWGIVCWLFMGLLMIIIANKMLKNPFTDMLEGRGMLVLNLDSTGVIGSFVVAFSKGLLSGGFRGSRVTDAFDRKGTTTISKPVKTKTLVSKTSDNGLEFKISSDDLNDCRFAFNQYPVLIYNEQAGTFIRKSHLSKMEKELFAYNKLIFLSKKVERLSEAMLNFGRYIVDNLKPKNNGESGLPNWIIVILVILGLVLIGALIMKTGAGGSGALSGAFGAAKGAVVPIAPA